MSATMRSGADEALLLRARCAELELLLAQQNELVADLTTQNHDLSKLAQTAMGAIEGGSTRPTSEDGGSAAGAGTLATLAARDTNYQLRKEIISLTEQKTTLEQQLHRVTESMSALQVNLTREIQRAREEGERQSVFLRSQLVEAKEHAALLQEKLVGQLGTTAEAFRQGGMHDAVTERILITSEAVLHRFKTEHPVNAYRTRYDVAVEFDGRYMVLAGNRLNVQLLKAEVLEVLANFYSSMTDPTKYVPAAKAREHARTAEADHLRRTVSTHEATIASLHTAIRHAQDRSDRAVMDAEAARSSLAVEAQKMENERALISIERAEHQRIVEALRGEIADAQNTAQLTLRSLQSEAAVGKELRNELEAIRTRLHDVEAKKELAERVSYVAREQSKATEHTFSELMVRAQQAESEQRRAEHAERELRTLHEQITTMTREREQQLIAHSREKGKQEERINALLGELQSQKLRCDDMLIERDKAHSEVQAANHLIAELRERLGGARSTGGSTLTVEDMTSKLRRIEAENAKLRQELQRSFNDLKSMAHAMHETKAVREQALADTERLEMERSRLLEERQKAEMESVQMRMAFGARESELLLLLETAREEAEHLRARAEMLHGEYQARLKDLLTHVESRQAAGSGVFSRPPESPSAAVVRSMLEVPGRSGDSNASQGVNLDVPTPRSVTPTPFPPASTTAPTLQASLATVAMEDFGRYDVHASSGAAGLVSSPAASHTAAPPASTPLGRNSPSSSTSANQYSKASAIVRPQVVPETPPDRLRNALFTTSLRR